MSKITLDVEDSNLPIVLNILENLKKGLIQKVSVNKLNDIKPIRSSLDKIETNSTQQINQNKYLSKSKYKQKMNQRPQEDEFLPKSTSSSGKYLSRDDFKNKLKKKS